MPQFKLLIKDVLICCNNYKFLKRKEHFNLAGFNFNQRIECFESVRQNECNLWSATLSSLIEIELSKGNQTQEYSVDGVYQYGQSAALFRLEQTQDLLVFRANNKGMKKSIILSYYQLL